MGTILTPECWNSDSNVQSCALHCITVLCGHTSNFFQNLNALKEIGILQSSSLIPSSAICLFLCSLPDHQTVSWEAGLVCQTKSWISLRIVVSSYPVNCWTFTFFKILPGIIGFKTLNVLSPEIGTFRLLWTNRLLICKNFQREYVLLVQRLAPFGHLIGVLYSVCSNLLFTLRGICSWWLFL